ncbi:MAG: chemotaxis protein CheW [Treponema sp.]|nr:MAG: chemotaxis protein CheW [Treponema sp.]
MSDIKDLAAMIAENDEEMLREQLAIIDFKMVTFSLAGKDYAIDIMRVKEIAKAGDFTYVPNTSPFVLGVYNLRGEIIPIIDLRIFFNIPVPKREKNQVESMVIINANDQKFGVVVDIIDKVVGVSKQTIQAPHPIFGDINIKYIQGVVENAGNLYVLLDVDMIFAQKSKSSESIEAVRTETVQDLPVQRSAGGLTQKANEILDMTFIADTLTAMNKFYPSAVNEDWMERRYQRWGDIRKAGNLQISNVNDADEFLEGFHSPFTSQFWSDAYINEFFKALPDITSPVINVWNVGCGRGHETYSFAVLMKLKYPNSRVKIFANDSDLLGISNATMLKFPSENVSSLYQPYIVEGVDGTYSFNEKIKDMILFEYHDCTNQNAIPDVDIILARDVLSFLPVEMQQHLLAEFEEKLKTSGVIFLGKNETMPKQQGWSRFIENDIIFFSKE